MEESTSDSAYGIVLRPAQSLALYEEGHPTDWDNSLQELRSAVSFVDPAAYWGSGRKALAPVEPDVKMDRPHWTSDVGSEPRAQTKLAEISTSIESYEECLITDLDSTRQVFRLLEQPANWEVIRITKGTRKPSPRAVGFDAGIWGVGYSVLADSVITPTWHPPDPADYRELTHQLRNLNASTLFETADEAATFLKWYRSRPWAETEGFPGEFCVVRVERIS